MVNVGGKTEENLVTRFILFIDIFAFIKRNVIQYLNANKPV